MKKRQKLRIHIDSLYNAFLILSLTKIKTKINSFLYLQDLLEMVIKLKDKLLPLISNSNSNKKPSPPRRQQSNENKSNRKKSRNNKLTDTFINNRQSQKTVSNPQWPSAPTMQYIQEDQDINTTSKRSPNPSPSPSPVYANHHNRVSSPSGSSVHWNLSVKTPSHSSSHSPMWSNGSPSFVMIYLYIDINPKCNRTLHVYVYVLLFCLYHIEIFICINIRYLFLVCLCFTIFFNFW